MTSRYDQFKDEQRRAKEALAVVTLGVGGVSGLISGATVARMAINPFSPLNLLRAPVAAGAAVMAGAAIVAAKKLHDCQKENSPCP